MKTHLQFSLAALTLSLLSVGRTSAGELPWQAIDHHHGTPVYLVRSAQPTPTPTIAFTGHPKASRSMTARVQQTNSSSRSIEFDLHVVATPRGTIQYLVPVR